MEKAPGGTGRASVIVSRAHGHPSAMSGRCTPPATPAAPGAARQDVRPRAGGPPLPSVQAGCTVTFDSEHHSSCIDENSRNAAGG